MVNFHVIIYTDFDSKYRPKQKEIGKIIEKVYKFLWQKIA